MKKFSFFQIGDRKQVDPSPFRRSLVCLDSASLVSVPNRRGMHAAPVRCFFCPTWRRLTQSRWKLSSLHLSRLTCVFDMTDGPSAVIFRLPGCAEGGFVPTRRLREGQSLLPRIRPRDFSISFSAISLHLSDWRFFLSSKVLAWFYGSVV